MEINLTPEEEFIKSVMKARGISTPDKVISAALLALDGCLFEAKGNRERTLADIQVGLDKIERGEGKTYDSESLKSLFETVKQEGRQHLAEQVSEAFGIWEHRKIDSLEYRRGLWE